MANVDDYSGSARLLPATTLRNVLWTRILGHILAYRESLAQERQVSVCYSIFFQIAHSLLILHILRCLGSADRASGGERCPSVRESPAEAAIEARAKVIAAEGGHKASRALNHAAEVIIDKPAALHVTIYLLQLRTVQWSCFPAALSANTGQ